MASDAIISEPETHDPIDPWVGISRVEQEVGLGRSTIYRRMEAGTFPRPKDLGGGVVRWPLSVIRAWKESRPDAGAGAPATPPAGAGKGRRPPGRPRRTASA
jgi:prophage regulatory protein